MHIYMIMSVRVIVFDCAIYIMPSVLTLCDFFCCTGFAVAPTSSFATIGLFCCSLAWSARPCWWTGKYAATIWPPCMIIMFWNLDISSESIFEMCRVLIGFCSVFVVMQIHLQLVQQPAAKEVQFDKMPLHIEVTSFVIVLPFILVSFSFWLRLSGYLSGICDRSTMNPRLIYIEVFAPAMSLQCQI